MSGHNPMRWNCDEDGCFNKYRRPKIEMFADCFPGQINFGDVDGMVEINGFFALLEWKGEGGCIKTGQRISYENHTKRDGNIVFCVEGDAETMEVKRYCVFWEGGQRPWKDGSLEDVKAAIRWWVARQKKRNAA